MIKVNQPTERERLESKADFYLDNFYELESDQLKMRYLVKICGGIDEVANLLFTHVYGLEDWDSFEDEQLEQLTENLESSYRELFDEEVEKEFVDQVYNGVRTVTGRYT
jgi:hypothetical protein